MPFQKGHKGFGRRNKRNKKGNTNSGVLDLYYTSKSRFKKTGKNRKLLDPEEVDYYLNNNMDVTELYGEDEDWKISDWYDEDGNKLSYHKVKEKRKNNDKDL